MTLEEALYVLKNTAWLGTDADREKVEEAIRTLYIAERPEPTCINSEKMRDTDDTISRQAAIDAVNTALFPKINTAKDAEKALRNLPSAQPDLQQTCNQLATDIWDKLSEVYNMENVPDAALSIIGDVMLALPSIQPERKKDIVQKFHDYQVEWLKSHYDIVLEPQLEEMIVRFLHDTANSYMMDIDRGEGEK